MDIFYLKKSEFLPNIDPNSLKKFSDGRIFKSKDKEEEHLLGIFLTKFINIKTDINAFYKSSYGFTQKIKLR